METAEASYPSPRDIILYKNRRKDAGGEKAEMLWCTVMPGHYSRYIICKCILYLYIIWLANKVVKKKNEKQKKKTPY